MPWTCLTFAIVFEVAGTLALKKSNGFAEIAYGGGALALYAFSLVLLAIALRTIEVGIAYAIWSALGTAIVVAAGVMMFGESMSALKIVFIALIVVGVVGLRLVAGEA